MYPTILITADIMSQALGYEDYNDRKSNGLMAIRNSMTRANGQYYIIFQAYMKNALRHKLLTN